MSKTKIFNISSLIFIGIFSLGEIARFEILKNFVLKPIDFIIILIVLAWSFLGYSSWRRYYDFKDPLLKPILLFVSILFVSLILNAHHFSLNEIFVSFSYSLRWILYFALYLVVKSFSSESKKRVLFFMGIGGGLVVVFGFLQYFLYPNLRNLYYLGWDEHAYRMFSTFLDPNFAGTIFILTAILLSGTFFYFKDSGKNKSSKALGILIVINLIAIFLTFSRSAILTLLVSAVVFSVLLKKIKFLFAIFFACLVFLLIASRYFYIENVNLFREASSRARIESANIALQIIEKNPVFGVGFDAYRYAKENYGFKGLNNIGEDHSDSGTDNSFLFVFATTGIVGLFFFINMLWSIIKKAYLNFEAHKSMEYQKYVSLAVFSSIIALMVNSLFINSLFYSFVMIWFWILLGTMENR